MSPRRGGGGGEGPGGCLQRIFGGGGGGKYSFSGPKLPPRKARLRKVHFSGDFLGVFEIPKGPSRTRNTTESEFRYGRKFGTDVAKGYGEVSEMFVFFFLLKRQKNGRESEKLRR